MKYFKYIGLISFLLTACTVEKRIHLPGYHVEWNKNFQSTKGNDSGESNPVKKIKPILLQENTVVLINIDSVKQENNGLNHIPGHLEKQFVSQNKYVKQSNRITGLKKQTDLQKDDCNLKTNNSAKVVFSKSNLKTRKPISDYNLGIFGLLIGIITFIALFLSMKFFGLNVILVALISIVLSVIAMLLCAKELNKNSRNQFFGILGFLLSGLDLVIALIYSLAIVIMKVYF